MRLLLLAAAAVATAAAADPVWIKATTPNFELYTSYGEKQAVAILKHFEQIRLFFGEALGTRRAAARKVRLVAFRSAKEFQRFAPNDFADAFYLSSNDRDYIVMKETGANVYRVAVHEYVHLVIRHSGMKVPLWMNEGLAELYSTMREIGNKTLIGELIPGHVHQLRNTELMDLDALLAVDHDSPVYNERSRAGIFYSQSWAMAHMLNLSPDYHPRFGQLMANLAEGRVNGGVFERVYGRSSKQVREDLQFYIRGDRFNGAIYNEKLSTSTTTPSIEAADEVDRGLLFSALRQYKSPVDSFNELTDLRAQYPNRPEPAEALAYLVWRRGDVSSAIDLMLAAVAAGSRSARLHFDCAMLGQMKGRPAEEAVRLLDKAVELQADFKEAFMRLAEVNMRLRRYAPAIEALVRIAPADQTESIWYYRTLAYANHQLSRKEQAIQNAALYARSAREPKDIADAERLLAYVKGEREFVYSDGRPAMPLAASQGEVIERIVPGGPALKTVRGMLIEVDCAGNRATLIVQPEEGKPLAFLIDDPSRVSIRGTEQRTFEFTCGPQSASPVGVGYEERTTMPAGIHGLIRQLEIQSK